MSKIKFPEYTYKHKQALLCSGTIPVTLYNARNLMEHHHFVLAWDGEGEPDCCSTTLAILTSVNFTTDKIQYGVHTCGTDCDLKYDNAAFIDNRRCPEVIVKSEGGSFVGRLIGVDIEKGMAIVQQNDNIANYSMSIVAYVDDVNFGLRTEEENG